MLPRLLSPGFLPVHSTTREGELRQHVCIPRRMQRVGRSNNRWLDVSLNNLKAAHCQTCEPPVASELVCSNSFMPSRSVFAKPCVIFHTSISLEHGRENQQQVSRWRGSAGTACRHMVESSRHSLQRMWPQWYELWARIRSLTTHYNYSCQAAPKYHLDCPACLNFRAAGSKVLLGWLAHREVFSKVGSPRLHSTAMKPFHGLAQSGFPAQSTLMFPMYSANVYLLHHSDFHLARSCQTDRLGGQTHAGKAKAKQSKVKPKKGKQSEAQLCCNFHKTIIAPFKPIKHRRPCNKKDEVGPLAIDAWAQHCRVDVT